MTAQRMEIIPPVISPVFEMSLGEYAVSTGKRAHERAKILDKLEG